MLTIIPQSDSNTLGYYYLSINGNSKSSCISVEAALDGPRRRASLPLPGVPLHLQDQAAAQRASEEAFGKGKISKCIFFFYVRNGGVKKQKLAISFQNKKCQGKCH